MTLLVVLSWSDKAMQAVSVVPELADFSTLTLSTTYIPAVMPSDAFASTVKIFLNLVSILNSLKKPAVIACA